MTVRTPAREGLAALRERARARFEALGLPTTRDEEWRQTSVAPIAKAAFAASPSSPILRSDLQASGLFPAPGARVVLVDEHTGTVLSSLYPVDLVKNASAKRRPLSPVSPASPVDSSPAKPTGEQIAPLLKRLMADYAATGLPPAYLTKRPKSEDPK